jgi:uncharacterized protein HemX
VSEADLPENNPKPIAAAAAQPDATPSATVRPGAPAAPSRSNGLAWLALLLALIAGAAALWSFWQLRNLPQPGLDASEQAATRAQLQALAEEDGRMLRQLEALSQDGKRGQLEAQLTDLQAEQQRQSQRLATLQDGGRQVLRLVEAEHLLRLASLRLAAMQDAGSAIALIQGADQVLRDQNDPAAFAVRKELARSLEQLRSLDHPDRTGLFLQLAALREQLIALQGLSPSFVPAGEDSTAADVGHWQRWWNKVSSFVRIDLQADQDVRPLLSGQSLAQVRLAMSLAIEQAQWAVLNGEEAVYRQALAQAQEVLGSHYNLNVAANRALHGRLGELARQPVSIEMPDLAPSLKAFQAYLKARQSPQPEEPSNAEAEVAEPEPAQ